MNRLILASVVVSLCLVAACSRHDVIPDRLESEVNKRLSFEELKTSPSSHKGKLVVLGGEVLSAKRLEDRTRIELLQLPLTEDYVPISKRTESQGRFLAVDADQEMLDPAVLKEGTPVTIVGEVTGATAGSVGDSEYQYPTLTIKDMTVWDTHHVRRLPYPYGYYGYGYRPYYWW